MESFDIRQYLEMALRRKYQIIIPFLVCLLGGLTFALITPPIYESETLILVQAQRVPSDYVRSIISGSIEDRLHTITQQVTSRTNLEKIIKGYDLYQAPGMFMEDKVAAFRKQIDINIAKSNPRRRDDAGSAFTISFRGEDPRKVMQVTNALASNFIDENLKIRETQAIGTSAFLNDELENLTNQLREQEQKLEAYQVKHLGGLPEQLQANLSMLERLQMQLDQLNNSLQDAENRKLILQKHITDSIAAREELMEARKQLQRDNRLQPQTHGDETSVNLEQLKNELAVLESKYTSRHPDVVRKKKADCTARNRQAGRWR